MGQQNAEMLDAATGLLRLLLEMEGTGQYWNDEDHLAIQRALAKLRPVFGGMLTFQPGNAPPRT